MGWRIEAESASQLRGCLRLWLHLSLLACQIHPPTHPHTHLQFINFRFVPPQLQVSCWHQVRWLFVAGDACSGPLLTARVDSRAGTDGRSPAGGPCAAPYGVHSHQTPTPSRVCICVLFAASDHQRDLQCVQRVPQLGDTLTALSRSELAQLAAARAGYGSGCGCFCRSSRRDEHPGIAPYWVCCQRTAEGACLASWQRVPQALEVPAAPEAERQEPQVVPLLSILISVINVQRCYT